MSRVDEARRRAAADAKGGVASRGDQLLRPLEGDDVAALARAALPSETRQPYSAEASGRREIRPSSVHRDPPTEAPPTRQSASLFDRFDSGLAGKTVIDVNMLPAPREQYRRLAATLHDAQRAKPDLRVVMVASAVAGEGKTLTATNLALTFSESYQKRVLLVDADLRRPMLDAVFHLDSAFGLGDALASGEFSKLVVRHVSAQLAVLPAGRPNADPMAGLTSERMRRVIGEAKQRFDWVILDTPPLALLPDAHLLGSMVDGAILVVRAESTPHALIKRAADAIGSARMLGVVLNQAQSARISSDDYAYRGYEPAQR